MKRVLTAIALLLCAAPPVWAQDKPAPAQEAPGQEATREPDPVVQFSDEDEAMNAAVAEARATYPRFLAEFDAAPEERRQYFMLKVGLPADGGGHEHIWVDGLHREGGRLVGVLSNEPVHLPGMHLGSRIEIDDALVSDWAFVTAEGMYGSYTTRVMLPYVDPTEAAQLRQILTASPTPAEWTS